MNDQRPEWKHDISEDEARWFAKGCVTKITHHWEMTGVDTSRDWIELHRDKEVMGVQPSFLNDNGYFTFKPNWRELVTPTWRGEQALKDLESIDAWEAANKRDRATFERLKHKFGAS